MMEKYSFLTVILILSLKLSFEFDEYIKIQFQFLNSLSNKLIDGDPIHLTKNKIKIQKMDKAAIQKFFKLEGEIFTQNFNDEYMQIVTNDKIKGGILYIIQLNSLEIVSSLNFSREQKIEFIVFLENSMKVYFSDRSVSKNIFYTNPKEPMLGAIVSYEEVKKQN